MKSPLVTIILINYNGFNNTKECVNSLLGLTYDNYKILIVDNGSTDGSFIKLKEKFSNKLDLIETKKNLGFSGGNNFGTKYALKNKSDFILLLNNDTVVEKDFLEYLVSEMINESSIGVTIPKIYYYKKNIVWSAGGYISKLRGTGITYGNFSDSLTKDQKKVVNFGSGCCLLIRAEVLEQIGGMDENYFLYVEDADLSKKVTYTGAKILYVPKSKIYHKVNSCPKRNDSFLPLYYTTRNRLYFSKKNLHSWFFLVFIYLATTMFIKGIYWLITNQKRKTSIVIKAFYDFFSGKMGKSQIN